MLDGVVHMESNTGEIVYIWGQSVLHSKLHSLDYIVRDCLEEKAKKKWKRADCMLHSIFQYNSNKDFKLALDKAIV